MSLGLMHRLARCRRGSLPVMTAVLMFPMIVLSGGAIDLIAFERMRTRLQDGLDRGVLAAASLTQTMPAEETIRAYLQSTLQSDQYELLDFHEENATNVHRIEVSATAEMKTAFLALIDIPTLKASAHSKAEERRSNIEISLILDISGSMRFDGTGGYPGLGKPMRIDYLRPAANSFIDQVLSEATKDFTTVNIVPYAGQVNVGPVLFDHVFNGVRRHTKSSCFELVAADFTLGIPNFTGRTQSSHFTQANHHDALKANEQLSTEPWWCPDDPHAAIPEGQPDWVRNEGNDTDVSSVVLMSNDREALKRRINQLKLYDGTGTPIALKWGLMMLDPALRPKLAQARTTPSVATALGTDPRFNNRPADFTDRNTMKFIVLMTDGAISSQLRPTDQSTPIKYNNSKTNTETISTSNAGTYADRLCTAAKNNGVIVFTIGFDVNETAATQMRNCANAGNFYRVNALSIADAFKAIATAIQQVKLVG